MFLKLFSSRCQFMLQSSTWCHHQSEVCSRKCWRLWAQWGCTLKFWWTLKRDPIATTFSLIRGVQICLCPSSECDYWLSIYRSNHHLFVINIFQIYFKLLSRETYNCCKMWTHNGPQPFWWLSGHFFCTRFLTLTSVHSFHELTSCLQAIDQFFEDYVEQCGKNGAYFPELAKFKLAEWEWSALQIFQEILQVYTLIITHCSING